MAVNISPFPSVVTFPAATASHQTDTQRCTFSRKRGRWTLQADCELSAALDLPANVTLDGAGHTMTLIGDAESFDSTAVRGNGGDIVNLTLDGSRLLPIAPAYFAVIALAAPGRVAQTTVRNIHFTGAPHTAIGIEVAAFDNAAAVAGDITLENISGVGLLLTGNSQITAERVAASSVTTAIQVNGTVKAMLDQPVIERSDVGVLAQNQACVRINASGSTGEIIAEDQALIHQDTLTFIGARDREQARRRTATAAPHDRLG